MSKKPWENRRDLFVDKTCKPLNDFRSAERSGLRHGWDVGRSDAINEIQQKLKEHIDGSDVRDDVLNDFLYKTILIVEELK